MAEARKTNFFAITLDRKNQMGSHPWLHFRTKHILAASRLVPLQPLGYGWVSVGSSRLPTSRFRSSVTP
jgi:hypothetical protein